MSIAYNTIHSRREGARGRFNRGRNQGLKMAGLDNGHEMIGMLMIGKVLFKR